MNQNSNLMMGKEENENTSDQWFMTGIIFFIMITVPMNILEF